MTADHARGRAGAPEPRDTQRDMDASPGGGPTPRPGIVFVTDRAVAPRVAEEAQCPPDCASAQEGRRERAGAEDEARDTVPFKKKRGATPRSSAWRRLTQKSWHTGKTAYPTRALFMGERRTPAAGRKPSKPGRAAIALRWGRWSRRTVLLVASATGAVALSALAWAWASRPAPPALGAPPLPAAAAQCAPEVSYTPGYAASAPPAATARPTKAARVLSKRGARNAAPRPRIDIVDETLSLPLGR